MATTSHTALGTFQECSGTFYDVIILSRMFHSLVIVPGHVYKDLWTSLGSPSFSLLGLPLLPSHCPLSFTLYTYISISISISLRVPLAEALLVWPCPLGLVLP